MWKFFRPIASPFLPPIRWLITQVLMCSIFTALGLKHFLISVVMSSLFCELFNSVFLGFQICGDFLSHLYDFSSLKLVRLALRSRIWSVYINILCVLERVFNCMISENITLYVSVQSFYYSGVIQIVYSLTDFYPTYSISFWPASQPKSFYHVYLSLSFCSANSCFAFLN